MSQELELKFCINNEQNKEGKESQKEKDVYKSSLNRSEYIQNHNVSNNKDRIKNSYEIVSTIFSIKSKQKK